MCSHFNTDDGRKKAIFWHTVLYYFKKGKNATEMQKKKNCAVYGGGAVTEQICQMWFVKFHVGNFPLDDAPRSGRPIAADSEHMKT